MWPRTATSAISAAILASTPNPWMRLLATCSFSTTNVVLQIFGLTNAWKYTTNNLDGVAWQGTNYSDSGWLGSGPGNLYVENNTLVPARNTPLPGTPMSLPPTYYFRTHFNFSGNSAGVTLSFSNYIDDGAVFYLNGFEIQRVRMPASPASITYSTLTTASPPSGDATSPDLFTISGDLTTNLVSGEDRK